MTLTLELTVEQEALLWEKARAIGVDPAEYLIRTIDGLPAEPKGLLPGETLLDAFSRLGAVGAVEGKARPGGRAWSEGEGLE
jgi:hypothetical protein